MKALRGNYRKLCRLEFLQPDGSIAFVLDNNEKNRHSRAFIQEGKLTVNLQNGARRQASVTVENVNGEFDYAIGKRWFGEEIRLMEGLVLGNGQEFYLPQGVFLIKDPKQNLQPGRKTAEFPLVDKWANLDGTLYGRLEGTYELPMNSSIFPAMEALLTEDRGNGRPVDRMKPVFTHYYDSLTTKLPDGTTVPYTKAPYTLKEEGETGTIANVFLGMNTMLGGWIGYDPTGRLRVDPSQDDILDTSKPVQWEFTPNEKQFLGATYTVKNSEVFNDLIINGGALDNYPTANARAQNLDPSSDTNINLIGRKTCRESQPGYYTNDICQSYANFKLKRMTVLQKSVSITSTQMFHIQENNLVTIRRIDKPGAPLERHLIQGFSRPLGQTGSMTIDAVSVNDFPIATVASMPWDT